MEQWIGWIGMFISAILLWLLSRRIKQLKLELQKQADAHKRSMSTQRAIVKGQLAEQLYPLMPDCAFLPSDMRFFGHPIDYVVFDGLTSAKDTDGEIKEIVFVDVKTGDSRLSAHQRKIKQAVEDGRVRWLTVRCE